MNQKERMKKGLIYDPNDEVIMNEQLTYLEYLYDYNQTRPTQEEKRQELLKKMMGKVGTGCHIEPPFHANWGGKNVYMEDHVYVNFNFTVVDDDSIYIGDAVMIGPNVTIATANHPIDPTLRRHGLQYNREVHIGRNVWIGAGVIIVPGVTIGENSVIGAGSVVTKDIPSNVVAFGNPCQIQRKIGEHDHTYFYKEETIDWQNLEEMF